MIYAHRVSFVCSLILCALPVWAETLSTPPPVAARTRIVRVHDGRATKAFEPDETRVAAMFNRALLLQTRQTNVVRAWRSLVSTQDMVGIKVVAAPGPRAGTRVTVAAAAIAGLIEAGVPAKHVIVWDKHLPDLEIGGFRSLVERYQIRMAGSAEAGYDATVFYENALIGNLLWGDLEFGKKGENIGRRSFVSTLLSGQITKIVNIAPLLNHNVAGVNGCLYSLATGSVDNYLRFEAASDRMATGLPELFAMPALGDKVESS